MMTYLVQMTGKAITEISGRTCRVPASYAKRREVSHVDA